MICPRKQEKRSGQDMAVAIYRVETPGESRKKQASILYHKL